MIISDLSQDLVEEILCRVPATSLKRLRPTCKRWNALFIDHKFTKKHYDKAAKEFMFLMLMNDMVHPVSINLSGINNINTSIEVKGQLGLLDCQNSEIFHCNGLLLCTKKTMERDTRLVVYNPCTGQTRWIGSKIVDKGFHKFALGCKHEKSCSASYKILRISCPHNPTIAAEFEMYEFKSNSWRFLNNVTNDWCFATEGRGVSLKGNTYWIASDRVEHEEDGFLLKFDFTKERFQRLRLPFKSSCNIDTVVLSTVKEEKLAVFYQDEEEQTLEIWLTNKIDNESVSWSMLFKVEDHKYMFGFSMSFMVDVEKKLALCCDADLVEDDDDVYEYARKVYILGEVEFTKVDLLGVQSPFRPFCGEPYLFSYVPSLVHI